MVTLGHRHQEYGVDKVAAVRWACRPKNKGERRREEGESTEIMSEGSAETVRTTVPPDDCREERKDRTERWGERTGDLKENGSSMPSSMSTKAAIYTCATFRLGLDFVK